MLRIHFTPADLARVSVAPRPAPAQELNVALTLACRPDGGVLHGTWRRRALRGLTRAARPLAELVPAGRAPGFLDSTADSLPQALDRLRATPPVVVRGELERVYAPVRTPAPAWIHDLSRGEDAAWRTLAHAQRAAFAALLEPVWEQVRDLHHAEFVRRAVQLAEGGVGAVLAGLVPGARLEGTVWTLPQDAPREVRLDGRGLLLLPTFHGSGGGVLLSDLPALPDRPVVVTYPAGPGLPPRADGATGAEALGRVLGGTRTELLHLLGEQRTTSDLARELRVSAATVSAHTAALRGAGLIATVRAGKAVLHRRTALGGLLLRGGASGYDGDGTS
ncbi:helix-turn-helix domain-containing protein [Streptacidiphilus jiangxiensis]|uniref:Regulatory protein, arsR family n=1 Tax=Streptacidiphilus jiangxiensis TaxID=235985 RepID=A0A1H7YD58_STRJI|nr:helix-turn-helix domain-containing protein [Streptacidiphilus jiangxiensis]SEM44070.1 regulatory protein, arsR family [Streptacidiphilus jiangxiensis]